MKTRQLATLFGLVMGARRQGPKRRGHVLVNRGVLHVIRGRLVRAGPGSALSCLFNQRVADR
jgi:hypothetical protein